MADAADSKSAFPKGSAGSSPASAIAEIRPPRRRMVPSLTHGSSAPIIAAMPVKPAAQPTPSQDAVSTGSLWDRTAGRGVPGLAEATVRAPTAREVAALRKSAVRAEQESPFRDEVPEELLRRPLR